MTVDDHNIITQTSSGGTAQHDHKGNITQLNGATYYYDDENQLTGVMLTPTKLYSFLHDGKRRKRKQIEFNLVGSTWTPIAETWYIYDGMTVIQERSNKKIPTVQYTRGLDLSGSLGGAGGIGGLLTRSSGYNSSTGAWSTHDYYHADGSGNITMLISNSTTPTIRAQYEYDPFGRIQTQSGSLATANTQRFSSKEQIGNSPLSYYGYRFYHADAQRWMNRDPIGESGGLNLYGFVQNNSVNRFDKLGLFAPPNPNSKAIVARCVCRAAAGAEAGSATGPLGTVVVAAGAVATELVLIDAVLAIEIAQLQAENERTSEQIEQKDREYNQYKARCNQKPPGDLANHGNDPKKLCELWRWQLQRNKDCVSLRQAFSDKWYGGPDDKHKRTIEHYEDSIKNLDEKIKRLCKPCP